MPIESSGHSRGNPRLYELVEHTPKTGKSPTVWAWPQLMDYLKIAGQPVAGPWPPHQQPRPDPEEDWMPVAVPDPEAFPPGDRAGDGSGASASTPGGEPGPAPGDPVAVSPDSPGPEPEDPARRDPASGPGRQDLSSG